MILKIKGPYNGHHDAVMVSTYPNLEALVGFGDYLSKVDEDNPSAQ